MKKQLLIIALILLSSCSIRIADLTYCSTRNVEKVEQYKLLGYKRTGNAKTVDKAVDDCLRKNRGDLLKNVRIYRRFGIVRPLIFGRYKVTGDVWGNEKE